MIYELILDEDGEGVRAISLVENPAIEENWITLSAEEYNFAQVDEEKRLVMGAVLVPDKPIIRRKGDEEYYVYFTKETIRKTLEKYSKSGNHRQATLEHELAIQGVTNIESWIKEDEVHDKSALYNLSAPVGSWIATLKVDSPEVWNLIKEGRVKGFSIEGLFKRKEAEGAELSDPKPGESRDAFLSRCMGELADEFPDESQRYAVCNNYFEALALEALERSLSNKEA